MLQYANIKIFSIGIYRVCLAVERDIWFSHFNLSVNT